MSIFRKIYLILISPIFILVTFLTAVVTIVATAVGGNRVWGYWPAHLWSRFVCFITGVKVVVRGRENIQKDTSYIFVANHQGAFDIWAIYGYLNHNFKWLMKKSLERIAFVGYACRRSGHVFVDSNSVASIRETIDSARNRLKDGMSLVIFPEGTRSKTGDIGDFKRGAFLLAGEFRLPVVPLSINGAFNIMPRNSYFPRSGKIILTIHAPIYPGEKGFNTRQLMFDCHDIISKDISISAH